MGVEPRVRWPVISRLEAAKVGMCKTLTLTSFSGSCMDVECMLRGYGVVP